MPEDKWKRNPEESYTNKYQKHIACSYGYKLVCADDKLSKSFKTYIGQDAVYNLWIKSKSLLEHAMFKLGCNAESDKNWAWTYSRSWHVSIFWKRYKKRNFLYF